VKKPGSDWLPICPIISDRQCSLNLPDWLIIRFADVELRLPRMHLAPSAIPHVVQLQLATSESPTQHFNRGPGMELALTFGAIGDFLSIALLIKDIASALDESRGSAKAYRGLIDEITQLHRALEQVDHIYQGPDIPSGLSDLISIAQTTVSQVRETLKAFHGRICKKYGDSLAEGGSGNIFKDSAKRIQFKLEEKDVANFRTELSGHRMSLELFLQITTV